jgi:hypothetical protein
VLEVVAGPEDGRRLVLSQPGQVVGRWDPTASEDDLPTRLFLPPSAASARISRAHLVFPGPGRIQAQTRTARVRGSLTEAVVSGEATTVKRGDVLLLRDVVRLLVVRA